MEESVDSPGQRWRPRAQSVRCSAEPDTAEPHSAPPPTTCSPSAESLHTRCTTTTTLLADFPWKQSRYQDYYHGKIRGHEMSTDLGPQICFEHFPKVYLYIYVCFRNRKNWPNFFTLSYNCLFCNTLDTYVDPTNPIPLLFSPKSLFFYYKDCWFKDYFLRKFPLMSTRMSKMKGLNKYQAHLWLLSLFGSTVTNKRCLVTYCMKANGNFIILFTSFQICSN